MTEAATGIALVTVVIETLAPIIIVVAVLDRASVVPHSCDATPRLGAMTMNRTTIIAGAMLALANCAQPKPNLQLAEGKEPSCVRDCSGVYSQCVPTAGAGTMNRMIAGDVIVACNTGFEACLAACPPGK